MVLDENNYELTIAGYKRLVSSFTSEEVPPDEQRFSLARFRDAIMAANSLGPSDIVVDLLDMGAGEEEREESIDEWTEHFKSAGALDVYVYEVDEAGMIYGSGDDYITVLTTKPIPEEHAEILADIYYNWGVDVGPRTGIPIYMIKAYGEQVYQEQKAQPAGTCHSDAWRFLIKQGEGFLIHGSVQLSAEAPRINHAWVELPSGWIWEPQTKSYFLIEDFHIMSPVEEHRYTVEEAAIMAARTGNHGPWSYEERRQWL